VTSAVKEIDKLLMTC